MPVRAEQKPTDESWIELCLEQGIILCWLPLARSQQAVIVTTRAAARLDPEALPVPLEEGAHFVDGEEPAAKDAEAAT